MLNDRELTKGVSPAARAIIGVASLLFGIGSLVISYLAKNDVSLVLSVVAGVPAILVGLSLLFGKGSKGKGILSPFTLYLFGGCAALASIGALFAGANKAGIGFLIAFGCFALAKKRSKENSSW